MIRRCLPSDLDTILTIINDAAAAYKGVIPAECWHEPYMTATRLAEEAHDGVEFYGCEADGTLAGVMGIQHFPEVTLIRHAYVLSAAQKRGVGGKLLAFLLAQTGKPVLIGTWRDTPWSIRFYEKHGFRVLTKEELKPLLGRYWKISDAHRDNSVVLGDAKWFELNSRSM